MSVLMHATVSAWQRQEDGSYAAEINGFSLHVAWRPETATEGRGFLWSARGPGGVKRRAHEAHEEIEVAMAEAEMCAAPDREAHESKTID